MKIGVIVARFQTSFLQSDDFKLIQHVRGLYDDVIIFLGVGRNRLTQNNPLDFETRKLMIKETFPRIEKIYSIKDQKSDVVWSEILDKQIDELCKGSEVVLHGAPKLVRSYLGRHKIEISHSLSDRSYKVRMNCRDKVLGTEAFRHGIIWASGYKKPALLPTVDVAIVDVQKQRLLVGRKSNEHKYRFIGGHADVSDLSFEEAAKREVTEECGGIETAFYKYLGSFLIDDWRYANEDDKIMSTFFSCDYVSGAPVAGDDIKEVKWLKITELKVDLFEPEHHVLLAAFKKHWSSHLVY